MCVCVCVCLLSHISPLERLLVLIILSCTQQATEVKGFCLKLLRSKVLASFAYRGILRGYCSDIPRTFSTAEPSKRPKKANNRLNATWNTTQCKAGSVSLLIRKAASVFLRLLTKGLPYTSRYSTQSSLREAFYACAPSPYNAPRVLHFSAFITL